MILYVMKVLPKDIVIYLTKFLTIEETFKIFILNKYFYIVSNEICSYRWNFYERRRQNIVKRWKILLNMFYYYKNLIRFRKARRRTRMNIRRSNSWQRRICEPSERIII